MTEVARKHVVKTTSILFAVFLIAYLTPVLQNLTGFNLSLFLKSQDGVNALRRSILFALSSTVINVLFSLFVAILLGSIPLNSKKGNLISFLIIPVMLGNVSLAFIGKIIFSEGSFFHQTSFAKIATLTFIQFWQYGTLFTYLFWLTIKNIPEVSLRYAQSVKMSFGEKVKDIILPACRNLSVLLFVLNFILSIYEDAKIQIIFKASVGTHTELVGQWLNRTYQSNSLLNSIFANQRATHYSVTILFAVLVLTILFALLFSVGYNGTTKKNKAFKFPNSQLVSNVLLGILVVLILFPLIYTVSSTLKNFQFDFIHLISPFLFTFLATTLATLLSIIIGVFMRLGWKNTLSSFNNRSLTFYILLFILQLIPPIIIYITGFQWLKIIGYRSAWNLQFVWIIGHIILILPLLISFVSVFHFRTSNNEIDYLEAHRFSFWQIINDSFLRRYKAEYLFTFLIGFSLIWNESIINNLLSDFIPSFVSEMKMSIEGRAADYSKGMNYLSVVLAFALLAIWLWQLILNNSFKQKDEIA